MPSSGSLQAGQAHGDTAARGVAQATVEYPPMQQSFVASDGIRIAYTIDDFTDPWRQAPTLLLLHAAMGSSKRWYASVPALCRDYRVVRMDLRGHGESQ